MSEEINETTSKTEQQDCQSESEQGTDIKAQIEEKLDTKIASGSNESSKDRFRKDLTAFQSLLNKGALNSQQGQNLLNYIIKRALEDKVQQTTQEQELPENLNSEDAFKEFEKENPNFFKQEGRSEILKYLNTDGIQVDKDELSKISKIVEKVEKAAIEQYIKKVAYEENLEKSNAEAKQKLQANAQNARSESKNLTVFTREQIGKMTSAEFIKNESLIMEQLRKGLIK